MHTYLLYRSIATTSEIDPEDGRILRSALRNNARLGVTGYLHKESQMYFQYFEGSAQSIDILRNLIFNDGRHTGVHILAEGQRENRLFPRWDMGFSTAKEFEMRQISGPSALSNLLAESGYRAIMQFFDLAARRLTPDLTECVIPQGRPMQHAPCL